MTIYSTLLIIAGIFPVLVYFDYRNKKSADNNRESEYDYNTRSTTFILAFTPFLLLFYTEHFWRYLLYLLPLYGYFQLVMFFANQKSQGLYLKSDIPIHASSGFMVTIIAYFIWFHQGVLAPVENPELVEPSQQVTAHRWPYYAFAALLIITFLVIAYERFRADKPKISNKLLVLMAFVNPLLPLITNYFWWGQLVGILVFLFVLMDVTNRTDIGVRGGLGFVMSYIYMMVSVFSVLLYAFLF